MTRFVTLIVLAGGTLPVALPAAHAADLDYGYARPIDGPYAYERPVIVERPVVVERPLVVERTVVVERPVVYAPPAYLPPRPYYARPFVRPWRHAYGFGYGYGPRPFASVAYGPRTW